MNEMNELVKIMKLLRDPVKGCPWDRDQTIRSILPYTLEESYELVDAIERDDMDALCGELGDLLFHIVYYSQMANEAGLFDLDTVIGRINTKLRRRHPHVFGDTEVKSAAEQSVSWEKIKAKERKEQSKKTDVEPSLLAEVGESLPAMMRAYKLQKRAATVGFDWDNIESVLAKIEEEVREIRQEMDSGWNQENIAAELGDLMFACINFARHTQIDPEIVLRDTNRKFEQRFKYIEQELKKQKKDIEQVSLDEMERLWQEAKSEA